MCIAILNTKTATLKKELLRNCWENNGDGAGMLYIDNNKSLNVFKELKDFNTFYNKYIEVKRKFGKRNIVLHFRISTHGLVNETNCHPFLVDKSVGFVHNGMIYDVPDSREFSDTYMFNQELLQQLNKGFQYSDTMMGMIEMFIGSGNKLIFLDDDDNYVIANEKAGHWSMGCWFSNSSYKQVNNYVDYGGIKKWKSTPGFASGNSVGYKEYGSFYTPKADSTNWFNEEIDAKKLCTTCDMMLYGVNELDAGKCSWCIDEEAQLKLDLASNNKGAWYEGDLTRYELDECDACTTVCTGSYNRHFNAFLCDTCQESLGA